MGQSLTFTGTGTDPEPNLPLSHLWTFGTDSGIPDATVEDPGTVTFNTAGIFTVTYTVTDGLGLADPTPDTIQVTVRTQATNFTAYNDLAWGTGQLTTNITRITSPNGGSGLLSSGQLLDFDTGTLTSVTLAVTSGEFLGDTQAAHGSNPTTGDAFTLFDGKVSGQGAISYIDQADSPRVLTFTGLDPSKTYDLAFFAHRDNYGWDRASRVTISGAEVFTNQSSAATDNPDTVNYPGGVLFTSSTSPSTRLPADNDNGYVTRFTDIDSGSDGEIVLTINWEGTSGFEYKGKYGSSVRLQELDDASSPDTTPPTVTLTEPTDGATVSGTITVSASATDEVGVAGVQFQLNGANLGTEDTTEPFSIAWDTTTVANDTYTLTAVARDAAGNTTTSAPVTVTVSNTTSDPSSLTITNLTVASGESYVVPAAGLQAGELVYIDRSYTFNTVPASLQGEAYIQTANDDKAATTESFLSFDVNIPVTVYVAHDSRITTKPAWLSTFTDTGLDLTLTSHSQPFDVFAQNFSAGTVTLGGNTSGGGFSMGLLNNRVVE